MLLFSVPSMALIKGTSFALFLGLRVKQSCKPNSDIPEDYDDENGTPYVLFSLEYEEVALNVLPPILLSQGSPRIFVKFSCAPYS